MKKIAQEFVEALKVELTSDDKGMWGNYERCLAEGIGAALQVVLEKYATAKHVHYHPGPSQQLRAVGDSVVIEPSVVPAGVPRL